MNITSVMSSVAAQLRVGTVVSITCARLNLTAVTATVTRSGLLGTSSGVQVITGDNTLYAFFGAEVEQSITIVSQP